MTIKVTYPGNFSILRNILTPTFLKIGDLAKNRSSEHQSH